MLNLLANEARDCKYLWYFDPDIFVKGSWSFFADGRATELRCARRLWITYFPRTLRCASNG
jgi:hypothetical protein